MPTRNKRVRFGFALRASTYSEGTRFLYFLSCPDIASAEYLTHPVSLVNTTSLCPGTRTLTRVKSPASLQGEGILRTIRTLGWLSQSIANSETYRHFDCAVAALARRVATMTKSVCAIAFGMALV